MELLIAFATDDGEHINNSHFGMAQYYRIYRFAEGTGEYVETQKNVKYSEDESLKHGDPEKAKATASALNGIAVIVGKKFGPNIVRLLRRFVCVVVRTERVSDAVQLIRDNMDRIEEEKNKGDERKHIVLNTESR